MGVKTIVTLALVSVLTVLGPGLGSLTGSAQAGEYYTRKRVNGVWMTGRFARQHPVRTAQLQTKTEAPVSAPVSEKPPQRVAATVANAGDDLAPAFQRAQQIMRSVAAVPIAIPVAVSAAAKSTASATAPAPTSVAFSDEDRLLPLRRALEARAKIMAVSTVPSSRTPPTRNIKAVTFNFETGLRTSIYNDGSVVEDHFDPDTTLTGSIKY
jgi:hypothetical protein